MKIHSVLLETCFHVAIRTNTVRYLEERKKAFALGCRLHMTSRVWNETFPEVRSTCCFCFREVADVEEDSGLEKCRVWFHPPFVQILTM